MIFTHSDGRVIQVWETFSLADLCKMHPDLAFAEADYAKVGMVFDGSELSDYVTPEPVMTQQLVAEIKAEIDRHADAIYDLYATRGWEYDAKVKAAKSVIADPDALTPAILQGMIESYRMTSEQAAAAILFEHEKAMDALVLVSNTRMSKGRISSAISYSDAIAIKDAALSVYRQIEAELA